MTEANIRRLFVIFAFLAVGPCWAGGVGNDPYAAERYYSSPQKFVGEKIKIRIFKIEPLPDMTAADLGYVWFQGYTSRGTSENINILLRVEQENAERFARSFQNEVRTGRMVDGIFGSRSTSVNLSPEIAKQVSFFLTVGERAELEKKSGQAISGSLMVTPSRKKTEAMETPSPVADGEKDAETESWTGPKLILVRSGAVKPLQLREAALVEAKGDVLEVLKPDGTLQGVIGKSSVVAILPAPSTEVTREKAAEAVELYQKVLQRHPEAEPLLEKAHQEWKEIASRFLVAIR